jgi:8-oxo-dGTP pyrophosphatase MutT (NUDIX family)
LGYTKTFILRRRQLKVMERISGEGSSDTMARDTQLELLKASLQRGVYPGYPSFRDRLFMAEADLSYALNGGLILPKGPWEVEAHQNQVGGPATEQSVDNLGGEIDAQGHPLHPWFRQMVSDPGLGVVTGKGAYWHWGKNLTADPVVIYRGCILLVKRNVTDSYSLPGGFRDGGEDPDFTARREALEETGIAIPPETIAQRVYSGPVVDTRVTANAWPETTVYAYLIDDQAMLNNPRGSSENSASLWLPIDELGNQMLFGSHRFLVQQGLCALINS